MHSAKPIQPGRRGESSLRKQCCVCCAVLGGPNQASVAGWVIGSPLCSTTDLVPCPHSVESAECQSVQTLQDCSRGASYHFDSLPWVKTVMTGGLKTRFAIALCSFKSSQNTTFLQDLKCFLKKQTVFLAGSPGIAIVTGRRSAADGRVLGPKKSKSLSYAHCLSQIGWQVADYTKVAKNFCTC